MVNPGYNSPLESVHVEAHKSALSRPPRMPRLRLLPVTIVVAGAMLTVRVSDIWKSVANHDLDAITIAKSEAQQPAPPGGRVAGQASPAAPVNAAPAGGKTLTATPAANPAAAASGAAGPAKAPAAQAALPNGNGAPAPNGSPAAVAAAPAADAEPPSFTQQEVDVLQKLAARRSELDQREQQIATRENLIKAAEGRIDQKVSEMKALQEQIQGLLKQVDQQDDAKFKNLVVIYQNMKPAEAARIWEQLDMPVVLGVVNNMKAQNVSPIMAAMAPDKAKAITDAIATRRTAKIEGAAG